MGDQQQTADGKKKRTGRARPQHMLVGDWLCPACGDHQFAKNLHCRKCQTLRPMHPNANLQPLGIAQEQGADGDVDMAKGGSPNENADAEEVDWSGDSDDSDATTSTRAASVTSKGTSGQMTKSKNKRMRRRARAEAARGGGQDGSAVEAKCGELAGTPMPLDPRSHRTYKKETRRRAKMKIETLDEAFTPMISILVQTLGDEYEKARAAQKLKALLSGEDVPSTPPEGSAAQVERILQAEEELFAAAAKQRSFEGCADPRGMLRAADYSDRWFSEATGTFNTYYICRAGGDWPCNTITLSKVWDRFQEDPHAVGQRWYCHCKARYNTKFGMLCELYKNGVAYYCLADIPPETLYDARGMLIAQKYAKAATPEQLYAALPAISPLSKDLFQPVPGRPGSWKVLDWAMLEAAGKLDWYQLYNVPSVAGLRKARQEQKQAEKWAKWEADQAAARGAATSSTAPVAQTSPNEPWSQADFDMAKARWMGEQQFESLEIYEC